MIYKYTTICLMALIALFVIHLLIINLNYADSFSSEPGTAQGLYSPNDKVVILTTNDFDENVFNSSSLWVVQFYNSYCGHCMRFSALWKQLGADIYNWRSVVKAAVIDCANDENTQRCREFEIMAYPTIRFFEPNTANFTVGEEFLPPSRNSADELREGMLTFLETIKLKSPPKHWPQLTPIKKNDIDQILLDQEKAEFILVIEEKSSFLGRNLIMDFSSTPWLSVKRILRNDYDKIEGPFGLISISKNKTSAVIKVNSNSRISTFEAIRLFFNNKGYNIDDLYFKNAINEVRRTSGRQTISHKKLVHTAYQSDLEAALSYSLAHEIAIKSQITGECLDALVNYLKVIEKYFHFNSTIDSFPQGVLEELSKSDSITGKRFKKLLEQQALNFFSRHKEWVGCTGSNRQYRGYTCGLWMLFHYMTIKRYKSDKTAVGVEVLAAMRGYIKHFFGCKECSEHFILMSQTIDENVSSAKDEVMWLWRSHNNVNRRLAGDKTEDPFFPKTQFPHHDMCTNCRFADQTWNEEEVLNYLVDMYTNVEHKRSEMVLAEYFISQNEQIERTWNFSLTDVNTCIALYALSACLLTVYTIKLFLKRYPRSKHLRYDITTPV